MPAGAQDKNGEKDAAARERIELDLFHEKRGDILVTASRVETSINLDNYTGSASVLTPGQLENRQVRDIAEALRDVPGVAVSGVAGQTQVRLRGSEANHVLVLVDGIEVSDPFAGEFDLTTLQAEPGARVEVLRGPQSALYGPDAIGGVIAYQSASGRDLGGFSARIEGGTQGTANGAARYGASGAGWDAALSAVVVSTDGQPNARGGSRDIGRDSYTVSAQGGVDLAPGLSVRAVGRYILTEGRFNNSDNDPASPTFGFIVDSPEVRYDNEAVYALIGARYEALDGAWTHDLSAQVADIARDTFGPAGRTNGSEGDRLKASYVTAYAFDTGEASHTLTFAADWERERFRNTDPSGFAFTGRRQIENTGLVGEYRLETTRFDFSAALRHDINDRFADETTYRIGAGYDLTDTTRLRAAAASGIKNPGFFELFGFVDGRFIGNADLRPEKSEGWEVGIDQRLFAQRVTVSATYFDSELEGEIFTTFPPPTFVATPGNRDTVSTQQGVEVALSAAIGRAFTLNAAYSHIDSEEDGTTEVRRPEDIASAALTWSAPGDAASATLVVRHNGAALDDAFIDPSFVPVRVVLDDYTLVNLNARVRIAEGIEAFGRIDNLLDERYEQVFSFVSPGRSAVIGIEARF
ncbi:TonB-dependent siderophore receptor [Erythrobacter sp.]|uniref:TonB-dependent receptor plug domain-containing protein n=1 Tax=Erythrobacter sp. TaxID=1042 RepID=UPI001425F87F|nr:TonB-dependent receptor [Erythrobacter sp.]QIQ86808.1 MAG: TonB-dependent receptor [Erythrobacter sp.]